MVLRKNQKFPSSVRLKTGEEFRYIRKKGRFFKTPHFLVYVLENDRGYSRVGVTASRKVGNAPQRNRAKRVIREVFRHHLKDLIPGRDFSIVARKGAPSVSYSQAVSEIKGALTPGEIGESR